MSRRARPLVSEGKASAEATMVLARARVLLDEGPLLLASDFDGTLSKLVQDPWGARIIPRAQRALRRLAATPGVHVALVSGRTVEDLAERTRVGGISYRGDHGVQRAEAPRGFRLAALRVDHEPAGATVSRLVAALVQAVPRAIPESWLVVEDKTVTATFHFRGAPDVAAARARVLAAVDAVDPDGLLLRSGSSRALELRPPGASTKGDALGRLIVERRPAAVIMLGDDHNDALAFDVLRAERRAARIEGLAIAVKCHGESSTDVVARADVALPGPAHAARLLWALASSAASRR
ncbi:MAG: trehalose-phosphatase [Chloroflexota bacterium]